VPLFEYKCKVCNNIDEKLEFGKEMEQDHFCSKCGKPSERIVSLPKFKLEYNPKRDICDWQGNTSMYWKDVKAARERGEDVKPAIDGDKY